MGSSLSISGAVLKPRDIKEKTLTILSETDQLLRRFGAVEVVWLDDGDTLGAENASVADSVWSVIAGEVKISLEDQRGDSPTFEVQEIVGLNATVPQILFVPFGVTLSLEANAASQILKITTHEA